MLLLEIDEIKWRMVGCGGGSVAAVVIYCFSYRTEYSHMIIELIQLVLVS